MFSVLRVHEQPRNSECFHKKEEECQIHHHRSHHWQQSSSFIYHEASLAFCLQSRMKRVMGFLSRILERINYMENKGVNTTAFQKALNLAEKNNPDAVDSKPLLKFFCSAGQFLLMEPALFPTFGWKVFHHAPFFPTPPKHQFRGIPCPQRIIF